MGSGSRPPRVVAIKRLDPTFDPKEHGCENFTAMVKSLDRLVEVKKGDSDQVVRLRD